MELAPKNLLDWGPGLQLNTQKRARYFYLLFHRRLQTGPAVLKPKTWTLLMYQIVKKNSSPGPATPHPPNQSHFPRNIFWPLVDLHDQLVTDFAIPFVCHTFFLSSIGQQLNLSCSNKSHEINKELFPIKLF